MKIKTDDNPAEKIVIPNTLLLEEVTKALIDEQTVMLKATGNSMLPFIVGGRDSVLLKRPSCIDTLHTGLIVLAQLPCNRYVLHRIVDMNETEIVLMGDGNICGTESCRHSDVIGVVTQIIRNGHHVECNSTAEQRKAKLWGKLRPIRRYLLYIYKRIWIQ